ncbi:hypothetical protein FRC11_013322 [Ceratobasidium sp. 423]|nr:hypothetical protein FRC11_013322 [Ceratobasidium sp. 423]
MGPPTNILDHIVHLSPPGKLSEAVTHWERLGFKVTPGGKHAGRPIYNALVALADSIYIELIAFEKPPIEPPASDDREKHGRDTVPFFCQDLTPRELRVPAADINTHDNTAVGITHLHLTVPQAQLDKARAQLCVVLDAQPNESDEWELVVPHGQFNPAPRLKVIGSADDTVGIGGRVLREEG